MEKAASAPGKTIFLALFVAVIMKLFLFDFVLTEGGSMFPSIRNGKVLVINRLAYGFRPPWTKQYLLRWSVPHSGDVVVFITPQGSTAVKRCAGITSEIFGEERFFALGDNSLDSYDSRSYGPVSTDRIMGKVMGIK
ncbi:MAG: signal peptidase I [Treponema sp.]|jgi:signal peptidase I|nr:signal peptidase I [Treponema sp.]